MKYLVRVGRETLLEKTEVSDDRGVGKMNMYRGKNN